MRILNITMGIIAVLLYIVAAILAGITQNQNAMTGWSTAALMGTMLLIRIIRDEN